ncbi:hypothetical protein GWK47_048149 [Chionoecetes opilio]|uniref:Uncharacterized protein n=1 Tax=Chionoecetes opilio TaxID=41210 RepID=A0A8J4Y5L8_CHIOP|nr:hypothetical protein GWK47_048149 [Chionoecetes opilio]
MTAPLPFPCDRSDWQDTVCRINRALDNIVNLVVDGRDATQDACLPAFNVQLHEMAMKVWQKMESEGWEQYLALPKSSTRGTGPEPSWFPRARWL